MNLRRKPGSDNSDEPFGANPLSAVTTSRFDVEPLFAPCDRGKTTRHWKFHVLALLNGVGSRVDGKFHRPRSQRSPDEDMT